MPGAYLDMVRKPVKALAGLLKGRKAAASTVPFKALDGVSGTLRPGTMTL